MTIETVTDSVIWEMLATHRGTHRFADIVDIATYDRISARTAEFLAAFDAIERSSLDELDAIDRSLPIDDQRRIAATGTHGNVVTAMLDGRRYAEMIWELIRP